MSVCRMLFVLSQVSPHCRMPRACEVAAWTLDLLPHDKAVICNKREGEKKLDDRRWHVTNIKAANQRKRKYENILKYYAYEFYETIL